MNEIDAKNIKEIIKYRERKVKLLKDGDMDINVLNETSTEELKKMLKEYKKNRRCGTHRSYAWGD